MGTCLECEAHRDRRERRGGRHHRVPECKTRLEVLDLHPVAFDYAADPKPQRG